MLLLDEISRVRRRNERKDGEMREEQLIPTHLSDSLARTTTSSLLGSDSLRHTKKTRKKKKQI